MVQKYSGENEIAWYDLNGMMFLHLKTQLYSACGAFSSGFIISSTELSWIKTLEAWNTPTVPPFETHHFTASYSRIFALFARDPSSFISDFCFRFPGGGRRPGCAGK